MKIKQGVEAFREMESLKNNDQYIEIYKYINYNNIYDKNTYKEEFTDIENYFSESLIDNRINLNIEILKNINLKLVYSLTRYDEIKIISNSFRDLYEKYIDFINLRFPEVFTNDDELLRNENFDMIYLVLEELRNSNIQGDIEKKRYERIKNRIHDIEQKLIKTIKKQIKYLNNDSDKEKPFLELEENLEKIKTIQLKLKDYSNTVEITNLDEEVKRKIQILIDCYRNNIKLYFENYNFFNAEKLKKELITLIKTIENVVCVEFDPEEINKMKFYSLEKLYKLYYETPIEKYRNDPPKRYIEEFSREFCSIDINLKNFYDSHKNKIIFLIENKYRDRINYILIDQNQFYLKDNELKKLKISLNYIDDDTKNYLNGVIESVDKDISGEQNNLKELIEKAIENEDYFIINEYGTKYNTGDVKNKINEFLNSKIKQIKEKLNGTSFDGSFILSVAKFFESFKDNQDKYNLIRPKNDIKSIICKKIKFIFKEETEFFEVKKFDKVENLSLMNSEITLMIDSNIGISNILNIEELIKICNWINEDFNLIKDYVPKLKDNINELLDYIALKCKIIENNFQKKLEIDIICSKDLFKEYCLTKEFYKHLEILFNDDIETIFINDEDLKSENFLLIKNTFTSKEQKFNEIKKIIDEYEKYLINIEFLNVNTQNEQKQRENFFEQINKKYNSVICFYLLYQDKKNEILDEIFFKKIKILQDFVSGYKFFEIVNFEDLKDLNIRLLILDTIKRKFNIYSNFDKKIEDFLKNMNIKIMDEIEKIEKKLPDSEEYYINEFPKLLINLQIHKENLLIYKDCFEKAIYNFMEILKKKRKSIKNIFYKLAQKLEENEYGKILITENSVFEGYSNSIFQKLTNNFGIVYVISNLTGDYLSKEILKEKYNQYFIEFNKLVNSNFNSEDEEENEKGLKIIKEKLTLLVSEKNKVNQSNKYFNHNFFENIHIILAHINAIYTLISSKEYFIENKTNANLKIPHPAQIISIFRLLGLDSNKDEPLENNLIQVGTGEGKSLVLVLTAVLFGLAGYEVYVGCYSKNLSERDKNEFSEFINFMGLNNSISYGNFSNVCENLINKKVGGDLRQILRQYIFHNSVIETNLNMSHKYQILLFDEVDIFFTKEFLGKIYSQTLFYSDPKIINLFELLWKERKSTNISEIIFQSEEYESCKKLFGNWETLLKEKVDEMIRDLKSLSSHRYINIGNKIGYKENDKIVYNIRYGFKTVFAYFQEWSKNSITRESLDENIGITILCSDFSFSEIPKMFDFIFGVSGSIESLNGNQKKFIEEEYDIKKYTYIPSIFGKNNLFFDKSSRVYFEIDEEQYYYRINSEITNGLRGQTDNIRAVLIFFKDLENLKTFVKNHHEKIPEYQIISEELLEVEINRVIKISCQRGKVSLITSSFGRGYDFIVRDEYLNSQGGSHVIITYFPDDISEEKQLIGRTARQGNMGSCVIIEKLSELIKYDINESIFNNISTCKYDLVNEQRNYFFDKIFQKNLNMIKQMKSIHLESSNLIESLKEKRFDELKNKILEINKARISTDNFVRVKIYIDATSSMKFLIENIKDVINKIFDIMSEIFAKNNIETDAFSLQIGCYRNYNLPEEELFDKSSWEIQSEGLIEFLNNIQCFGGWGEEAIEIALWDLNQEEDLIFAIIIGDSGSNSKIETYQKRCVHPESFRENSLSSEEYWNKSKYRDCIDIEEELNKIKSKKIPLYGFYVEDKNKDDYSRDRAENFFKTISKETNGKYFKLDLNNPNESEKLANIISKPILEAIGNSLKNEARRLSLLEDFNKISHLNQ